VAEDLRLERLLRCGAYEVCRHERLHFLGWRRGLLRVCTRIWY
jgi:hypothetical protein